MSERASRKWALLTAAVLCVAAIGSLPRREIPVEAATIAELEAQKAENNKKIAQYEEKLSQFEEDEKEEEAYQEALQNKIDTLQSNLQIIDTELETVKENIFNLNNDISTMEKTIAQQEVEIDDGLEEFKLRLRAMYVNGNDSLASALVGATDFYDLLSKYELISCVARHDDELVNNLKDELDSYNHNLETLEIQKQQEEQAQDEKEKKQQEMKDSMEELNAAYAESKAEKERLEKEQASAHKSIEELKKDNEEADKAEKEIYEAIRKAEEEAKRKKAAEEEARRKAAAEEAARRAAEAERQANEAAAQQAAAQQAAAQQSAADASSSSGGGSSVAAQPPVEVTEAPPQADYDSSSFGWPCPGCYYVSSGFGYRWGSMHKGIDIAQSNGAAVVASRSGTVIRCNNSCPHNYGKSGNCCGNGYGNYVIILHDDGTYSTLYGHMASITVSVGSYVTKGQTIGYVGSTGWSTGPHLHFEIRVNGGAVNPSGYLNY